MEFAPRVWEVPKSAYAEASKGGMEQRNTEQGYWDYVKALAAGAGIDPDCWSTQERWRAEHCLS